MKTGSPWDRRFFSFVLVERWVEASATRSRRERIVMPSSRRVGSHLHTDARPDEVLGGLNSAVNSETRMR